MRGLLFRQELEGRRLRLPQVDLPRVGALLLRGERPQVLLGPGERQYLFLGREVGRLCGPRQLQQLLDGVMLCQGRPPWPLDEGDVQGQVLERRDII